MIVFLLLLPSEATAQFNPYVAKQNSDARWLRAQRESAVSRAGKRSRDFVEAYGEDAVGAIMACSPATGGKLAKFYESGNPDKLPQRRLLLRAIAQPGAGDEVALHAITKEVAHQLSDLDNELAYCADPLSFVLSLRQISDGGSEMRMRRLSAQSGNHAWQLTLGQNELMWIGGGAGVVLLLWWRKRRSGGIGV
jgi:hypothetical protein